MYNIDKVLNQSIIYKILQKLILTMTLAVNVFSLQPSFAQFSGKKVSDCPRSAKQAEIWYFGEKAGIDFRSGVAVPLTDQDVMTAYKSGAVFSDSLGNLLCFTTGRKVWNRLDSLMPNATELNGDVGVNQPCILVPQPGDSMKIFLFTNDVLKFKQDNSYTTEGFEYTSINMKLHNGLGDAQIYLNASLLNPACQKVSAVAHVNCRDFWIMAHKWDSDEFDAYLLDAGGIHQPVVSHTGSVQGGGYKDQTNAYGEMKFSPDGTKIALAVSGTNLVELFDFDNSTGIVSNARSYTNNVLNILPYGLDFSSDSKMLFVSLMQIFGNGPPATPSRIIQFDLKNGLVNPALIDTSAGVRLGGMQVAPDGRIYVARTVNIQVKMDSLDVIYNPTRPGTKCNYNSLNNNPDSRFFLNGRKSIYGLPNFVQSYFNIPVFTWDSVCYSDITSFHITNKANIDAVLWNFGDSATSTAPDPVHFYSKPGKYMVTLTETFNGENFIDSALVTVYPKPVVNLGDSILLYSGASINLHGGGGYMEYNWSNGLTDSVISVEKGGTYWVEVKDWHCCVNSDSVLVKLFQYFIPKAFTPNNDGLNDVFRVIGLYKNIRFKMYIYDKWGQMVFQSDEIDKGWDGTYNGQKCPAGVYVWLAYVDFLGQDIITNGKVKLDGTVTLVR